MSAHLTYLEAVVTGLVQGVTELFPVSSLGHNVLIPALVGGNWATALNVSNKNSPYLAFIVGLHVATAIAMIAYFWRDWLRIVRGFFSSIRKRSATTADERLAWMIILATIPVGIVGAALQHVFITVFAKPELAALFLAINGVILLGSERLRRSREASAATASPVMAAGHPGPVQAGGPAARADWPPNGGPGPQGYSQQPQQQHWQGPGPRPGQDDDDWQREQYGPGRHQAGGPEARGQQQPGPGQYEQRGQYGQPGPGQHEQRGQHRQPDQGQYGGQPDQYGQATRPTAPGWRPAGPVGDPRAPQSPPPGGRHGNPGGRGAHAAGRPAAAGAAATSATSDPAVEADRRLSTMGYLRAVLVGSAQILALFPGISRDGIVTVTGMWRGMRREDAVRFSFLLSAPVILAAGALKAKDLTGPLSKGIHGPILVGSLIAFVCAYLSIRFLTKYFSEDKSLNPFGIYCLIAGLGSLAYLVLK